MDDQKSTTYWLEQLRAGGSQAPREVCERCWHLVVSQARDRLRNKGMAADAEDVAVSVFATFFRRTEKGEYAEVTDGNDLRQLFLAITRNKSLEHLRHEGRQKRGGAAQKLPIRDDVQANVPEPGMEAEWNDQCQWLLHKLDEGLREIALLRLDGLNVTEVAGQLSIPIRAVERKLALIREVWTSLGDSDEPRTN